MKRRKGGRKGRKGREEVRVRLNSLPSEAKHEDMDRGYTGTDRNPVTAETEDTEQRQG